MLLRLFNSKHFSAISISLPTRANDYSKVRLSIKQKEASYLLSFLMTPQPQLKR